MSWVRASETRNRTGFFTAIETSAGPQLDLDDDQAADETALRREAVRRRHRVRELEAERDELAADRDRLAKRVAVVQRREVERAAGDVSWSPPGTCG